MPESKRNFVTLLQYHVVEVLPDGSMIQRGSVSRLETAWEALYEIAKLSTNECFALHSQTRQIVAQVNVPPAFERGRKLIFQIAYTEDLAIARSDVLTHRGYTVTTVVGNERARAVLTDSPLHYDLFILGHGAADDVREEMIAWLRAKYPNVKILALNGDNHGLPGADYNVLLNGPETWMPAVARAVV